ncbi:hypothetical protein J42TS3_43900 [Paenibacillus vini]|uniref:Uncharacterized protein n=1 Tax=Paenibacillus vini TaxID=1476024 RepID=A0ABQ4MH86_9BACL|nr:hypothetical protein J42TS3_43900 [Paenibacillus vini]
MPPHNSQKVLPLYKQASPLPAIQQHAMTTKGLRSIGQPSTP